MSKFILDLEGVLAQLIGEHKKLLGYVEHQQAAMRKLDLAGMDASRNQQEACRLRIATLENRRRTIIAQLAKLMKADPAALTLARIMDSNPQRKAALAALRDELKSLAGEISRRSHIAGKLAHAVLGQLNTIVRLLAGAVEKAGLYTKHGIPHVSQRIGVMEAVG